MSVENSNIKSFELRSATLIRADSKGLFANYMDKISLRFGSDLVVAISAKPQA